jgi:predicted  nucleic acid-binding Zn-ribbon protein
MKTRHRLPSVFSIYMVDVLCCALGCVILLWLINFREARQKTAAASETSQRLSASLSALGDSDRALKDAQAELNRGRKHEQQLLKRLDDLAAAHAATNRELRDHKRKLERAKEDLVTSRLELARLQQDRKKLLAAAAAAEDKLATRAADYESLLKKLTAADRRIGKLQKELQENAGKLARVGESSALLEKEIDRLQELARKYQVKLDAAETRVSQMEARSKQQTRDIQKRLEELLTIREILSQKLKLSEKELESARTTLADLKEEKNSLVRQAQAIRQAVENRFAGIALTGKNVLFLVDMSGSMDLLDENTPDPDKWPLVCETVAKIMKSLPDLKKYQVLLFADKVRYPLGSDGRWLEYEPGSTPADVLRALRSIKPQGGTNMAAAFDEAFQFRANSLDTIYVLSDGLPNSGPGLPANPNNLSEPQKTEYLSKYVRARLKTSLNPAIPGRPRVRINTIGFFFESPEVGAFLWALAREHGGSFVGMSK